MMNIIMTRMTAMALLLVVAMITITAMVGVAVGVTTATMTTTGAEAALEQVVERARGVASQVACGPRHDSARLVLGFLTNRIQLF
jgi:hypothetical protein